MQVLHARAGRRWQAAAAAAAAVGCVVSSSSPPPPVVGSVIGDVRHRLHHRTARARCASLIASSRSVASSALVVSGRGRGGRGRHAAVVGAVTSDQRSAIDGRRSAIDGGDAQGLDAGLTRGGGGAGAVVRRRRLAVLGVVVLSFYLVLSARADVPNVCTECLCEYLHAFQGAGAPLPTKSPKRGPRSLFRREKNATNISHMPPKFRMMWLMKCALLEIPPP